MAELPIYEQAEYASTIRAPHTAQERAAYAVVVQHGVSEANAVGNILAPLEDIVTAHQAQNERAADLEALKIRQTLGFFARANFPEIQTWLRRVMFVAFMQTVAQRQLDSATIRAGVEGQGRPEPQPYGVSHEGAEEFCAQWMRHLGATDAAITRLTADGGIDVESSQYIAQVKNYKGAVGVAEIRELAGVASYDGRAPLFFTSGQYPAGAIQVAENIGMALFVYSAVEGSLVAANNAALRILNDGL